MKDILSSPPASGGGRREERNKSTPWQAPMAFLFSPSLKLQMTKCVSLSVLCTFWFIVGMVFLLKSNKFWCIAPLFYWLPQEFPLASVLWACLWIPLPTKAVLWSGLPSNMDRNKPNVRQVRDSYLCICTLLCLKIYIM